MALHVYVHTRANASPLLGTFVLLLWIMLQYLVMCSSCTWLHLSAGQIPGVEWSGPGTSLVHSNAALQDCIEFTQSPPAYAVLLTDISELWRKLVFSSHQLRWCLSTIHFLTACSNPFCDQVIDLSFVIYLRGPPHPPVWGWKDDSEELCCDLWSQRTSTHIGEHASSCDQFTVSNSFFWPLQALQAGGAQTGMPGKHSWHKNTKPNV